MESNDVGGYLRTDDLGGSRGASVKLTQRCRENQEEDKEAGGSHGVGRRKATPAEAPYLSSRGRTIGLDGVGEGGVVQMDAHSFPLSSRSP